MFASPKCCRPAPSRLGMDDVKAQVSGAAAQARGIIVPLALDAKDRLLPLALDARERIAPLAGTAYELARPVVEQARLRVADVVESDVKPRLTELRLQAVPVITDVAGRVRRAPTAKVEPVVEVVPVKRRHPVLRLLGVATLAAVVWLVVKTLLGSRDDGWEVIDLEEDEDAETTATEAEAEQTPVEYGEGSYRGAEPPEGFVIKGNERSMKYHVPTAIGYERTVTDLWFDSPEAAERAGFTRALR